MDSDLNQTIQTIIQDVPFGDVTFTVYRHANKSTNVVANQFRNTLFNDNEQAVKWILLMVKDIVDNKKSGTSSFTIAYHEGKLKKITEQHYEQKLIAK